MDRAEKRVSLEKYDELRRQLAETEAKLIHARDPDRKPLTQRRDALEARIQALEDGHLVDDLPPAIESTGTIPSRPGSDGEERR